MQFIKGVLISELLALWVEFFYKFGVKYFPKGFLLAIPIYFVYLCGLHGIFRRFKEKRSLWLIGIVMGGIAGLLLEWFLVGNSPWNKPAVFQSGQFVFHGAYPILGYLLVRTHIPKALRNRLFSYMVIISGITSVGFFFANPDLRKLWLLFLPLLAFVGLYYFIYRLRAFQPETSKIETMARLH